MKFPQSQQPKKMTKVSAYSHYWVKPAFLTIDMCFHVMIFTSPKAEFLIIKC